MRISDWSSDVCSSDLEKFDTGPSSWQKGYLDQAFGEAKNIYGQSAGSPYYQGDTYAGLDDNTKASLDRLKSYASGTALDGAGRIRYIGSSMASDPKGTRLHSSHQFAHRIPYSA